MKIMVQFSSVQFTCSVMYDSSRPPTSFKRSHAALSAPDPAAGHGQLTLPRRLLDTPGQVAVSLLWGHCSFLLYKTFSYTKKELYNNYIKKVIMTQITMMV